MATKMITETVQVTISSTEEEIRQVVFGSSLTPIGKLYERYNKCIESYKGNGYTIVSEDSEKLSFIAEKKYLEEEKN